jgi:hypothetical protein
MGKQTKGSAGVDSVDMGDGGTWETASVGRASGARWYRPDAKDPSHVLTGVLGVRQESETKYGPKGFYEVLATTPGADDGGDWADGEVLIVWESAGLVGLNALVGRCVRIEPAGKKGRAYTYKVNHRAA